jgi:anaerobic selenocysteine-containing dehydrogenase
MSHKRGAEIGVTDGDWVYVISHHGRIKVQVKLMDGVNDNTVWTWNAIGKRRGAWGLDPEAAEGKQGFLLNHIISELLPEREGGYRYSNSDPITGQAAWYDLKVRIEKAEAGEGVSEPQFPVMKSQPGATRRSILRFMGAKKP